MSRLRVETTVLQQPTHDVSPMVTAAAAGGDDDAVLFAGCVEVKAIEDPASGQIVKDEITVLVPLPEFDEDPLYYYPPSHHASKSAASSLTTACSATPGSAKLSDDEDSSDSDSDDDDDDDCFDDDVSPLVVVNRHAIPLTKRTTAVAHNSSSFCGGDAEYSFMEELLQTLDNLFGCSYGQCGVPDQPLPVLKSALRRRSDNDPPPIHRNVSWTKIEIKEFNMTLGNHPSAVTGPPVMLEATPTRESVVDLETYEKARQPRRTRKQLKLSFEARRGILERDRGFTVEEVKKAWSEALLIRKQRQETRQRTPQQQLFDEVYESACRKANRMFLWQ